MSQSQEILRALKKGKSITALECLLSFNCLRLAARVKELREAGYRIKTQIVSSGRKRYARYTLD
jgi:hypothetical protein